MPAEAEWLIPDKVVISRYWGKLTIEELTEVNQSIIEHIRAGKKPVYHIADTSRLEEPPININVVREATSYLQEPNLGYALIFGLNRIASFMATMISRFASQNVIVRPSLNECLDVIEVDPDIGDKIDQYRTP